MCKHVHSARSEISIERFIAHSFTWNIRGIFAGEASLKQLKILLFCTIFSYFGSMVKYMLSFIIEQIKTTPESRGCFSILGETNIIDKIQRLSVFGF